MPDLGTQIGAARQAGYSDADITAYLAKDPSFGPKVAQAKAANYTDTEIVSHLTDGSVATKPESAWAKAARITGQEFQSASADYKRDIHDATTNADGSTRVGFDPVATAKPVLDAARAALSPVKGVFDAAFGDQPAHLPASIAGIPVPKALQDINSKGLTGGDIAQAGLGAVGEISRGLAVSKTAQAAGVGGRTAAASLDASKAPTSVMRSAVTPTNDLAANVKAFDQAGVRPTLAATGGGASVAKAVAENPLAGIRVRSNLQGSLDDTANALNRTANSFGTPATRGAAGEAVQQGVQDFNQRFSRRASNLYDPVFEKLGTAQEIANQQVKNAADLQSAKGAAPVAPAATIDPSATAKVLSDLNGRTDSPALKNLFSTPQLKTLTDAVSDPSTLSFKDLRAARTWVREAQSDDSLRQGVSQSDLGRIEGALTQDINTNAGTLAGPQVARQLQQADQFYRLGSQRIQGALQKYVGKTGDASGESAYDLIARQASDRGGADTGRLSALKSSLKPSEWGDISASVINRMGQMGADNSFSVNKFVSAVDGLSAQGKDLLFGKGDLRGSLDNLVKVARMQKGVEQAANGSKTAVSAQALGTVAGLANPAAAIPTAGVLGSMALTGEIMTNPVAVRWLARLSEARGRQAALSSAVGRLQAAAKTNSSLAPLAQQAGKLLAPAGGMPAAASTNQGQSTPAPTY